MHTFLLAAWASFSCIRNNVLLLAFLTHLLVGSGGVVVDSLLAGLKQLPAQSASAAMSLLCAEGKFGVKCMIPRGDSLK